MGIKTFAFLSDGTQFENPCHFKKSERKLTKVQRRLSRKVNGSQNRNKQHIEVGKVHRKTRRQREDFWDVDLSMGQDGEFRSMVLCLF